MPNTPKGHKRSLDAAGDARDGGRSGGRVFDVSDIVALIEQTEARQPA
jgi:hypothetical protein